MPDELPTDPAWIREGLEQSTEDILRKLTTGEGLNVSPEQLEGMRRFIEMAPPGSEDLIPAGQTVSLNLSSLGGPTLSRETDGTTSAFQVLEEIVLEHRDQILKMAGCGPIDFMDCLTTSEDNPLEFIPA